MTLTITIDLDNAAFCNDDRDDDDNGEARTAEAARILIDLARNRLSCAEVDSGRLFDANGNTCGKWEVSGE